MMSARVHTVAVLPDVQATTDMRHDTNIQTQQIDCPMKCVAFTKKPRTEARSCRKPRAASSYLRLMPGTRTPQTVIQDRTRNELIFLYGTKAIRRNSADPQGSNLASDTMHPHSSKVLF